MDYRAKASLILNYTENVAVELEYFELLYGE